MSLIIKDLRLQLNSVHSPLINLFDNVDCSQIVPVMEELSECRSETETIVNADRENIKEHCVA